MKGFLIVLLSLTVLAGCVFIDADDASDETVTVVPAPSYTDWSWLKSIQNTVYVTLEANATTGYEWSADIDGESITLKSEEYKVSDDDIALVGAPGEWSAVFSTTGHDGISTVTLTYSRPWDSSDVADVIIFSVRVEGGVITEITQLK